MTSLQNLMFRKKHEKVLVLSGGGFRGLYTVGILKGLEELGLDKEIKAIFGVSIGAIVGSLRANGVKADEIYTLITEMSLDKFYSTDIFKKTGGMLSNQKIQSMIEEYLPKKFSDLKIKLYVGAVDTNTAKFILFENGDLQNTVLGSMSIPGIFPPVEFKNYNLTDGGILNNFPADIARAKYPKSQIIGVALNKFENNQPIKSVIDNVLVSFEIILRAKLLENRKYADHLFYKKIPISILSLDKKKMKIAFEMGYKDCIEKFGK